MKAADIISTLLARGVELWQEGGTLRYRARAGTLTEQDRVTLRAHKAAILQTLASTTASFGSEAVAGSTAVTEALPPCTESPELEPKDRLCYQCQHLAKSPYEYPLGLCVEHGNRIQHSTSEPTHFGCGTFEPKETRS